MADEELCCRLAASSWRAAIIAARLSRTSGASGARADLSLALLVPVAAAAAAAADSLAPSSSVLRAGDLRRVRVPSRPLLVVVELEAVLAVLLVCMLLELLSMALSLSASSTCSPTAASSASGSIFRI